MMDDHDTSEAQDWYIGTNKITVTMSFKPLSAVEISLGDCLIEHWINRRPVPEESKPDDKGLSL